MAKLARFSALHQPAQKVIKRRVVIVIAPPGGGGGGGSVTVTAGQNGINFITTITRGDQVGSYPGGTTYFQFGVSGPNEPPTPAVLTAITTGSTVQAYDESNVLVTNTTATTIGPVFWVQSAGSFYIPVTWTNGQPYLGMMGGTKIEVSA